MRDFSQDHRWLSINTATVRKQRGVDWPLLDILDACAARGIRADLAVARPGGRGRARQPSRSG